MSLLATLARLQAADAGRAVPLATVRHRHLAERPLVLVPLAMSGEAGAPWAAMAGTDPAAPRLLFVPQPLDREQRFAFLAELAEALLPEIEARADGVELVEKGRGATLEQVELCLDAAQLIVPNRAGIDYLALLGRSTRFRRTAESDTAVDTPAGHTVPARVPLLGRWLTHYAERARTPGSSLLLAATDLLSRHWATGQSGYEDLQLATQLAWIDPPPGGSGAAAADRAESERGPDGLLRVPPAGPATDPEFDNRVLGPALDRYDAARNHPVPRAAAEAELRRIAESQTRPAWDAVWHAIDLLRALPPARHLPDRWRGDRWSFTAARDRAAAGEPPQPVRDDAVTAARKLASRERAQAELDAQEALDDPLVLAERRLAGEAFAATVESVEMSWTEGRSPRPRPLLALRTEDEPRLAEGTALHRESAAGKAQKAEVVAAGPGRVEVRLLNGMGRRKEPDEGTVPAPGEELVLTLFEHTARGGPELPEPEDTPWTHGGPATVQGDPQEPWDAS